jgi:hypothetical protein
MKSMPWTIFAMVPLALTLMAPGAFAHTGAGAADKPTASFLDPDREELTLTLGFLGNFVAPEAGNELNDVLEMGGGAEIGVGLRANPYLGFELNGFLTMHQSQHPAFKAAALAGLTGDALLYIMPEAQRIEPYALVGLGLYFMSDDDLSSPLEGIGVQVGLGLRIRLNPAVSLAARALYRGAYLDNRNSRVFDMPGESAFISMLSIQGHLIIHLGE